MTKPADIFERIPDLLAQADEEAGAAGDLYPRQRELRTAAQQRGTPYLYSMPMRHYVECSICRRKMTEVRHELGDGSQIVTFNSLALHQVQAHGDSFPPGVEAFLLSIADRV